MRTLIAIATLVLAGTSTAVGVAGKRVTTGTLTGQTQISYGCPGPMLEGGPSCNPWRPYPNARMSVAALGPSGMPISGRSRVVVSDSTAHFTIRLLPGSYRVTPLPQAGTKREGLPVTVRVRQGLVTQVLVRFQGYPMMLAPGAAASG